jgi:GAF domain-containing protein
MYDHELYLRTLGEFTARFLRPDDAAAVLGELAERMTEVLGLAAAGVSLERDGRVEFHAGYGPEVAAVERAQEGAQEGPCVTALETGAIVAVAELSAEHGRWPRYCSAADSVSISAVASIPMRRGDRTLGVIDLYGRGPRDWPDGDLRAASVMADIATVFLVHAYDRRDYTERIEQLQNALDSRVDIEQAKGVLACRHGIDPEKAFERLRTHARDRNLRLRDVARAVVRGELEI